MPYVLPDFNLTINIHDGDGNFPPLTPLRLSVSANMSPGRRVVYLSAVQAPITFLLLPALTDIRGTPTVAIGDAVECPAGSGVWYQVIVVQDVAKGFANEYRRASATMKLTPIPMP